MDRINDISFEIGGKLVVLIEHQSTINHNMALRLLLYIARNALAEGASIEFVKKITGLEMPAIESLRKQLP
jgi:hypothetical protein